MKDSVWERVKTRVSIVYWFMFTIAIVIMFYLLHIMIFERVDLLEISEAQYSKTVQIKAIRGSIYSCEMEIMAASIAEFETAFDATQLKNDSILNANIRPLCDSLAAMLGESSDVYYKRIRNARAKGHGYLEMKKNTDYDELRRMKTFPIFKEQRYFGGFIANEKEDRNKPNGLLASRTIGRHRPETNSSVGLELAYNKYLSGVDGQEYLKRVSRGVWQPIVNEQTIESENGKDIVTSIDLKIQDVAESALLECLQTNEALWGCAVLMEVSTGRIKAIANLSKNADSTYSESKNLTVLERRDPGSTFKLATAIAILEEGKYDTSTMVPTGEREFYGHKVRDAKKKGYGDISFKTSFEKSSNVAISYLVDETFNKTPEKFLFYLKKMRLDKLSGIDLIGERKPVIKEVKNWSSTTLLWMAFGYELELTPIQTLTLYNAVANNGKMMKPQLVTQILSGGTVVKEFLPEVLTDDFCSKETLNKVKSMLEGVVENGTARSLSESPYKIAGKTGTVQINYADKNRQKMQYQASFVGYFPADNPKYSCIVVINNPQKNRVHGGELAAPVFKEIGDKVFATLLKDYIVKDDTEETLNQRAVNPLIASGYGQDIKDVYDYLGIDSNANIEGTAFVKLLNKEEERSFNNIKFFTGSMPNLFGLGARDVSYIMEDIYGVKADIIGVGFVRKQSVRVGGSIKVGDVVKFELW